MIEYRQYVYLFTKLLKGFVCMNHTKNILAKLALFGAALIWGSSFILVKDTVDNLPPNFLIAIRFSTGCLILALIFIKRLKKINAEYLWQGAVIGLLLFLAYSTQTIGITDTTPGKNAFLTAIYCVIVPFMFWSVTKKRPDAYNFFAAFLCIIGIGLVSLTQALTIGFGDTLTLLGGVFFAAHLVAVSIFGKDKDPIVVTILQFFYAAIFSWITAFSFETMPSSLSFEAVISIVYLSVFCTAGALALQNIGQKYTNPSAAAILLSLESVFGVLFSIFLGYESLTLKLFCGFALIFFAVIISETKLSFLFGKNGKK